MRLRRICNARKYWCIAISIESFAPWQDKKLSSAGGKFLREPDFSQPTTLISGKNWSYTITQDGWVQASTSHCCSSGYINQNGRGVVALLNDPSTSYSDSDTALVPVKKGDVFLVRVTMSSHGSGSNSLVFYPYRK